MNSPLGDIGNRGSNRNQTLKQMNSHLRASGICPTYFLQLQFSYAIHLQNKKSIGVGIREHMFEHITRRHLATVGDEEVSICWKSCNKKSSNLYYCTSFLVEDCAYQLTEVCFRECVHSSIVFLKVCKLTQAS